jgi:N-acetylglucosamine malate deacetylase 1
MLKLNSAFRKCKVLVIGAHVDDVEFGCGATIARMIREGHTDVYHVSLSFCAESLPEGIFEDTIVQEHSNALKCLGIGSTGFTTRNLRVRHFPENRQEILEYFCDRNRILKPDIVFVPSRSDIHQDHKTEHEHGNTLAACNVTRFPRQSAFSGSI